MRRVLVGVCLMALVLIALRANGQKKDTKKSVGDTFEAMVEELIDKYKTAEKNKASQKDIDALFTSYGEKFIALAKEDPKDEAVLRILLNTMTLPIPVTKDGPKGQALVLLKRDHVKSTKFERLLMVLSRNSDAESASFVKAVLDENPDKEMREEAFKAYLGIQEQIIMAGKDPTAVAAARKEIETYRKRIKTEFKDVSDLFVGDRMPNVSSKNLDDKVVKLSDLKGKVVVLDVWATWCGPCRAMIPHERELVKKLKDRPFVFVSVSVDEKKDTLTEFLKENPMPWTHWWDGESGNVRTTLQVEGFPTIFVLDDKGVIRARWIGSPGEKVLDEAVERLLKEMEDAKKAKTE